MVETEVKIRIEDPEAIKSKLLSLGAVVTRGRHEEENTLYDFPSGSLRAAGRTLRVRAAGRTTTLTLKGPKQKSRSFKVRDEFETAVGNRGQLKKIVQGLGLKPSFAYGKRRTVLKKGRLTITIDETSVGNFLELEGRRHEIVRLARSLGYKRADFITAGYVELMKKGKAAGPAA